MMPQAKKTEIAAIIAAYNEGAFIGGVLSVLSQVEALDEILVVNDGSRDGTLAVALQAAQSDRRIRVINHPKNLGKGEAFFSGRENTQAGILLLLDADLLALKPSQVWALIQPVFDARADMTLGLFRRGRWNTDLAHRATPWLSGQRCLRSELMDKVSRRAAQGYGLETAITVAAVQNGWRTQPVWLEGVSHPASEIHRGFVSGLANRSKMYAHIVRAWFVAGGLRTMKLVFRREKQRRDKRSAMDSLSH